MRTFRDKRKLMLCTVIGAWIFVPSALVTGWAAPRSYLWKDLPLALTFCIVLLYGGLAWLGAWAVVSMRAKTLWAQGDLFLLNFAIIFQGMFVLGYFFVAGRRSNLLICSSFRTTFHSCFSICLRPSREVSYCCWCSSQLRVWRVGSTLRLTSSLQSQVRENADRLLPGRKARPRFLATIAFLGLVGLVGVSRSYQIARTGERHSYLGWCARGFAEIIPSWRTWIRSFLSSGVAG